MCRICVDFELGKLTLEEAYRNFREIYNENDDHALELWVKLIEAEGEEK